MIEQVEKFRAKLQIGTLAESEILRQREVDVDQTPADNGISAQVAVSSRRLQLKGTRIKVPARGPHRTRRD